MYKKLRNKATVEIRRARKAFEKELAKSTGTNSKSFWRYVNCRTKSSKGVSDLVNSEGVLMTEPACKAEALSAQYKKVFTCEDSPLPNGMVDRTDKTISDLPFTLEEVHKALLKQKKDKAAGPDGIYPRYLLEAANQLAEPLCSIFNKSLIEGKLP